MKQYEQQMDQITIEESTSYQVENDIIKENNEAMHRVHAGLSDIQYVEQNIREKPETDVNLLILVKSQRIRLI